VEKGLARADSKYFLCTELAIDKDLPWDNRSVRMMENLAVADLWDQPHLYSHAVKTAGKEFKLL